MLLSQVTSNYKHIQGSPWVTLMYRIPMQNPHKKHLDTLPKCTFSPLGHMYLWHPHLLIKITPWHPHTKIHEFLTHTVVTPCDTLILHKDHVKSPPLPSPQKWHPHLLLKCNTTLYQYSHHVTIINPMDHYHMHPNYPLSPSILCHLKRHQNI